MAPASLSSLPAELVVFVADHLARLGDLSSLARVDRKLYGTVNSIVYKRAVSHGDVWPLAWAAHCGVTGTLTKALAAGASPNHCFVDSMFALDWKRANVAARHVATAVDDDNAVWDTDNEGDGTIECSPETEDSNHAGTLETNTNQPSSHTNSDQWGPILNDSDRESDISMDEFFAQDSDGYSSGLEEHGELFAEPPVSTAAAGIVVRRYNALHLAVQAGHNDIVEILLDRGACIGAPCERLCDCTRLYGLLNATECPETADAPPLWSPLHIAICHGRSDTAKLLLARGAPCAMDLPRDQDRDADSPCATALHHAAATGLTDVVRYLLDNSIQTDVDVRDAKTLTPLYHAYAGRRWDSTVPLLLERGADINVDTRLFLPYSTVTPLGEACRLGHFDEADRLIDLGADVMRGYIATNTGRGLSPLHMCCMPSARPASSTLYVALLSHRVYEEEEMGARRMRTIGKLIAKGALLEARDCSGDTPLIAAAQSYNVPAIKALLSAGANIHERNTVGRTALMQAIVGSPNPTAGAQESPEPLGQTLRALFRGGARLDETDAEGNTILHLVFKDGGKLHVLQNATLRILFNMPGVDALSQVRNKDNKTPLQFAFQASNLDACDILVRRSSPRGELDRTELLTMFAEALTSPADQFTLDFVLDMDANRVLTTNPSLFSTLLAKGRYYTAIRAACIIALRGLPQVPPADATLLLCWAIRMGEYWLAYSLLDGGADVNACNDDGEYPLTVFIKNTVIQKVNAFHQTPTMIQFLQALLDRDANFHLRFEPSSPSRILNRVIALELETVLSLMLKRRPLSNDPRAARGFYLHEAVTITSGQEPCSEKIIDTILSAGPDLGEVNEEGDTPLSVLLKCLCQERRFTWRYHRFIKALAGPDVDINRKNNEGRSIADYLQQLMCPRDGAPGQTTFLTRRIQLVDLDEGKGKALKFLPRPHKRVRPMSVMTNTL